MKSIQTIRSLVLLAMLVTGLASCQKEEFPATGGETPQGVQLNITVTDGGYTSGDPKTRATENGYVTEFTAGDKIGLYVVKPNNGGYAAENVCLTLTNVNGTLTWQAPAGTNLWYEGAMAKYFAYFAYYPYQPTVNGTPQPTATTAADFFADVVTKWNPTTDQSTYAKYTASDLMIGSGTLGSKQTDGTFALSFAMTHAMALVVIETPATRYELSTDANYTWTVEAPDTRFYDFTPYSPSVGTYRYLVKPSQSGVAELNGSYTGGNGNTKEYAVSPNSINPANYRHNKVDGGASTVIEIAHTLQIGDFYLKDGSLLGKDENPTTEQQAACIGIVFWLGDATANDATLKTAHPECTHGLVVALTDASESTAWQSSYISVQNWLNSNKSGVFLAVQSNIGANDPLNNIQGYNNTQAIEAFNGTNSGNIVQAVQTVVNYRTQVPAPVNSSDWYLPSEKELTLLCGTEVSDIWNNYSGGTANRDLINGKLSSISSAAQISSAGYWSSTEYNSDRAFRVYFGYGNVRSGSKDYTYRVRCALAF